MGTTNRVMPDVTMNRVMPDVTTNRVVPDVTTNQVMPDVTTNRVMPDVTTNRVTNVTTNRVMIDVTTFRETARKTTMLLTRNLMSSTRKSKTSTCWENPPTNPPTRAQARKTRHCATQKTLPWPATMFFQSSALRLW